MIEQTPLPEVSNALSHEVLKELRDNSRFYLKLDLTYLAAAGAIVTILKLNRYELVEFAAGIFVLAVALVVLLTIDMFVDHLLLHEWISAKTKNPERRPATLITGAIYLQPLLHLMFVGGVILYGVGFAKGVTDVREAFRVRAQIQDEVDLFISKERRIPESFEEVRKSNPRVDLWVKQLRNEPIAVEKVGEKGYRLIFAGDDGRLRTSDDYIASPEIPLRHLLELIEKRESK